MQDAVDALTGLRFEHQVEVVAHQAVGPERVAVFGLAHGPQEGLAIGGGGEDGRPIIAARRKRVLESF